MIFAPLVQKSGGFKARLVTTGWNCVMADALGQYTLISSHLVLVHTPILAVQPVIFREGVHVMLGACALAPSMFGALRGLRGVMVTTATHAYLFWYGGENNIAVVTTEMEHLFAIL